MTETKPLERPAIVTEEHLRFLDALRESGKTNMFGAAPFVQKRFKCSTEDARTITIYWMESFSERHPS